MQVLVQYMPKLEQHMMISVSNDQVCGVTLPVMWLYWLV